jgi:hypothetical protein
MANPHPISRKNKPNKASTSRIERAVQQGRCLPHDALLLIAERALATAARFQPSTEEKPNPEADIKEFAFWLDRAREAYHNAAPYYAPRLAAIAVASNAELEEHNVDPRELMWQTYLGMRRRGELAQKTIEATKLSEPQPNDLSTARPAAAGACSPDKEDDADGVAA